MRPDDLERVRAHHSDRADRLATELMAKDSKLSYAVALAQASRELVQKAVM